MREGSPPVLPRGVPPKAGVAVLCSQRAAVLSLTARTCPAFPRSSAKKSPSEDVQKETLPAAGLFGFVCSMKLFAAFRFRWRCSRMRAPIVCHKVGENWNALPPTMIFTPAAPGVNTVDQVGCLSG